MSGGRRPLYTPCVPRLTLRCGSRINVYALRRASSAMRSPPAYAAVVASAFFYYFLILVAHLFVSLPRLSA